MNYNNSTTVVCKFPYMEDIYIFGLLVYELKAISTKNNRINLKNVNPKS